MMLIIRKIIHKASQIVVISLISLLLGEVSLRIYNHFNPLFIFYSDSYNRFRGKPLSDDWDFKLNSQGFKDTEFTTERQDRYRILGIGDSFTFGVVPYKYNYLTLLESQLNQENYEYGVEVINMGIPSIGPTDYLSLLVREGLELHPDMVILSFFIGNDFIESKRAPEQREWYSYSYVTSLIHYLVTIRQKYQGRIFHGKANYRDDRATFDHNTYLEIERNRSFIYIEENKRFRKLFNDAVYYLRQINEICKKENIKLIVVVIPDELQINHSLQSQIKQVFYHNLKKGQWYTTLPNDMLADQLRKLEIDYVDLYSSFVEESREKQLYIPRNTHWNIAGNQLAANVIESYIHKYLGDNFADQ